MSLIKLIKQSNSKKVDNNKDIRVLAVKNRKITITTISTIFVSGKLLIILIKVTLLKNEQDIKVKKI